MKTRLILITAFLSTALVSWASVDISVQAFGKSLGGWTKRGNQTAEYPLSGSVYRTYKPEISPTPDGGIFVSIRIDHVRSWLASDDHATLEITVNSSGGIVSAQSNIAIQGQSISSDVILGINQAGQQLAAPDRAVQIGTDLVANLSAKLLRENLVEAGRVSFPAALRHNYNLLFQSIRVSETPVAVPVPAAAPVDAQQPVPAPIPAPAPAPIPAPPETKPAAAPEPEKQKEPSPSPPPLEIKPYGSTRSEDLGKGE